MGVLELLRCLCHLTLSHLDQHGDDSGEGGDGGEQLERIHSQEVWDLLGQLGGTAAELGKLFSQGQEELRQHVNWSFPSLDICYTGPFPLAHRVFFSLKKFNTGTQFPSLTRMCAILAHSSFPLLGCV